MRCERSRNQISDQRQAEKDKTGQKRVVWGDKLRQIRLAKPGSNQGIADGDHDGHHPIAHAQAENQIRLHHAVALDGVAGHDWENEQGDEQDG